MKSSVTKRIAYVGFFASLFAVIYWMGYVIGGNVVAASAVIANKKNASTGRALIITSANNAGGLETLDGLMTGPARPDAGLLADWVKGLSAQECVENMKKLQDLPAGLPRDAILQALVGAWAEKDPKGFLAGAADITVPKLREGGVDAALRSLASANPKDAFEWIKQNASDPSSADLGRRYAAAIGGYATVDPQGALDAVVALDESSRNDRQVKTKAVEGLADSMAAQGRFTDAVALFNQLPADKLQNDGLSKLMDTWAQVAPQNAASYISTVQDAGLVNDLGQSLTDVWAATDPAAAAKWAVQMDMQTAAAGTTLNNGGNNQGNGNNNSVDTLLSNAIDVWSKYDLNAAGQYLNQLPASTTKDSAIVSFVSRAAQDDPASAMNWAVTITDPSAQQKALAQVAKQWIKQDPAALNQFLTTTTTLTNQQKQAMASAAQASGKGG